jgi:hypothetical protein
MVHCFPSLRQVAVEKGFVNLELMMRLSGGLPLLLTRPHILMFVTGCLEAAGIEPATSSAGLL